MRNVTRSHMVLHQIQSVLKKYEEVSAQELYESLDKGTVQREFGVGSVDLSRLSFSEEQFSELLLLFKLYSDQQQQSSIEFVATVPSEVDVRLRKTIAVIREMIHGAQNTILVTGYAVSEYVDEIMERVLEKALAGVNVDIFLDRNPQTDRYIENIRGRNLPSNFNVYVYKGSQGYSSLHAKVIMVDEEKAFVSSANLSYNGIVNNIEIGTLVDGEKVLVIKSVLLELVKNNYFEKIIWFA
ncbi:phospholipase D-like domain-containing protein [Bacillus haynesii]|uniref:DISARM anti-phage system protein DrmC n=1 Tax=Bacillus haynesii TaxID=1925021 RepID=UPI00227EA06F|nr:phospholipase D-like domain-containing protein [Bacillus haynesii]MCY8554720.1 phospholipase D-like domain-containing protein [Bacillus haynesii]